MVAYGGVDLDNYEKSVKMKLEKLGFPNLVENMIGYVGLFKTMGMEKGINTMILALKSLSKNEIMIFIGGKKDEIAEYQKMARKNEGLLERCIFEERKVFQ